MKTWLKSVLNFIDNHLTLGIILLLPFNVLYRIRTTISITLDNLTRWTRPSAETHQKKVKRIQAQVKRWGAQEDGAKKKMCSARGKYKSIMLRPPKYRDTLHNIDMGDLGDVISIDVESRVIKVEPLVTMGRLTALLNPMGWTLPVVPEMDELTVGGLVAGGGLETSSHKYGLFHRSCRGFEIVLSSGEVVQCSKDENTELFTAIPISYGTLGFLTSIDIEIIPAKKYVKLEYFPAHSYTDGEALLVKHARDGVRNDFVEAFLYTKDDWVVMTGRMVDSPEEGGKINHVLRWYKPWFFNHVKKFLTSGSPSVDYIPLRQYYHRHTPCSFWFYHEYMPYGNNPFFRLFFGWMMPMNHVFFKSSVSSKSLNKAQPILQDFIIPAQGLKEVVMECDRLFKFYPVWICPLDFKADTMIFNPNKEDTFLYDVGIYGIPKRDKNFSVEKATKRGEELVRKYKGVQALYTDTYMTREEFRATLDLTLYDVLRKKYDAEKAFPDMYSKVSMKGRIKGL